jgi:hypothetical protein
MTDQTLTVLQAFRAMRHFLLQYNAREHSDSVEQLIRWTEQGTWTDPETTADPAQWFDWVAAVELALTESST